MTNQQPAANQPFRSNETSNHPNRPWLHKPYGQQRSLTSNNAPVVRAYHGEVTAEESTPISEPYDEHQDYEAYEEQFYKDAFWTRHENEPEQTSSKEYEPSSSERPPMEQYDATNAFFASSKSSIDCRKCHQSFKSNNKLHQHLRIGCKPTRRNESTSTKPTTMKEATTKHPNASTSLTNEVVESDVTNDKIAGYGFRGWQYVTAMIKLRQDGPTESICIDTGCTMSIIGREFLQQQLPKAEVRRMTSPITVRGVGQGTHSCNEYVQLDIYLQGSLIALIHRDVHIVDGMKAKILIGMDVIGPEKINLDIPQRTAFVSSCKNAAIPITVTPRSSQRVSHLIKAGKNVTISPYTHMMIPIREQDLPPDRDLLFEPVDHSDGIAVYAHIVDCNMATVFARNDSESSINLHQDTLLGTVTEYEVDACFRAHPDVAPLAATNDLPNQSTIIRDVFAMATETMLKEASADPLNKKERKMENGVTIYEDREDYADFKALMENVKNLFNDDGGIVDVPEEEWMDIPLVENWRDIYKPN